MVCFGCPLCMHETQEASDARAPHRVTTATVPPKRESKPLRNPASPTPAFRLSNQTYLFPPTMSSPSFLHGVVAPDQLTLSRDAREASPTRRRAALPGDDASRSVRVVACEACRIAKVRCSQHRPTCRRCTKRRVECVYTGRRTPSPSPTLASGQVGGRDSLGPVGRSST
jgi:hypothetical protein